jgi:hypothetical protein
VLERRIEIGLRRAPGATHGQIRIQFLSEALLLALGGGAAGLAAALITGALAGLLPAIKAARLSPPKHSGASDPPPLRPTSGPARYKLSHGTRLRRPKLLKLQPGEICAACLDGERIGSGRGVRPDVETAAQNGQLCATQLEIINESAVAQITADTVSGRRQRKPQIVTCGR